METKFTKGEWKSRGFEAESNGYINVDFPKGFITIYGGVIPALLGEERDRFIEEAEANAKLIAAAPEMFEALANAIRFIKVCPELSNEERRPKGLEKWESILKKATE